MKQWVKINVIGFSLLTAQTLMASGYKMEFQSASVLGDAGEAAVVEDAGTNWYNAAGLVYLPAQVVASVIDVYAPTTFTGNTTARSLLGPAFDFHGTGRASSHPNAILPAVHVALPITDKLAFGYSIVPAWGFTEDYGRSSIVRYDLIKVETKTLDIAPSLALKLNNQWSIAAGPDIHYFSVHSQSAVFTEPLTVGDSLAKFSGSDWVLGGHFGVLFRLNDDTRIGLNYRTRMTMELNGPSTFILNGGATTSTNSFKLTVPLPATTTLSAYRQLTCNWAVMGTIAYDQWSALGQYYARNYKQPPSILNPAGIIPVVTQPQNMHDTIDVSVGAHYRLNEQWLLRGSIKYEPTPTNDTYRDVSFPDGEKLGLQIGSRYQMTKKLAVDLLYGHVFVKTKNIHGIYPQQLYPNTVAASGHQRTSIDLLGAQLVWNI